MLDMNVGCGQWGFRPTLPGEPNELERLLKAVGISRAVAYPLEAYLWPDPQEANELRLPALAASSFFIPAAVLNPTLPRCLKDYHTCRQEWQVPVIRLMPNYHSYDLDDPSVDALAKQMATDGVVAGIQLRAEDERNQNPAFKLPMVPLSSAVAFAGRHPNLKVVVYGLARLNEAGSILPKDALSGIRSKNRAGGTVSIPDNLYLDLSFFEFESSLVTALKLFPAEHLLFGTHTPLFYPLSNVLKIQNSEAPDEAKEAVTVGNAYKLLGV